jgi:hypothetical protein
MQGMISTSIRSKGTAKDIKELERLIELEAPLILFQRLNSPWVREHTKVCQTPSILKRWKDSLPPNVAAWFFHECDIWIIENACYLDCWQEPTKKIKDGIIGTCYYYNQLCRETRGRGEWHQVTKALDRLGFRKRHCELVANIMYLAVVSGDIDRIFETFSADDFDKNYLRNFTTVSDLLPINCAGLGSAIVCSPLL